MSKIYGEIVDLSRITKVHVRTLFRWRKNGKIPRRTKHSKIVCEQISKKLGILYESVH